MNSPLPFDPCGLEFIKGQGLVRQLYEQLRERVLDGRLSGGVRLPASRDLAMVLGLSRNTVMRAYEQLTVEGFTEARVGDGTYVTVTPRAQRNSPLPLRSSTELSTGNPPGLSTGLSTETTGFVSSNVPVAAGYARALADGLAMPKKGPPRAFQVGIPAFDLFPFDVWGKLYSAFWRNPDLSAFSYQDPAGEEALRDRVAAYLRSSRGLSCNADQIVITCGAQQGISLCAQLLLEPGDYAAVENPGYRAAGHALASAGARLVGIDVDDEGLTVEALNQAPPCKVVYVTPAHQYPTGVTMTLARRLQLLEWARRTGGWIIEDDYDGEYRYSGAPLAPLAALDPDGRVIYVGTFGKVAFPALRLGYLVLPPGLAPAFARRRAVDIRHSEVASQWVMTLFIVRGHFQRHIRRMRKAALGRRNALLGAWPLSVPGCGPMPAVSAGLHVKVDVSTAEREAELVQLAADAGVDIQPLSSYWLPSSDAPVDKRAGLVLGFAGIDEHAIRAAVSRLKTAWRL